MLAASDLQVLDRMDYVIAPTIFICAFYFTLLGFGVIRAGTPDKGDEANQVKRLKLLRWLGPLTMIGTAGEIILKIAGVF